MIKIKDINDIYKIRKKIGYGSYGEVFEVINKQF